MTIRSGLRSQANSRMTDNSSKFSEKYYLQLPKIDTRETNLAQIRQELKERGVSLNSAHSIQSSIDHLKTNDSFKKKKKDNIKINKIIEVRDKIEKELNSCLNNINLMDVADEMKIKKALTLPPEKSREELIGSLKLKGINEKIEKNRIKDNLRREKLLRKLWNTKN